MNLGDQHLHIATGAQLDGDVKLAKLASSYPFLRQLDVIFPANQALENALESLPRPRYFKQKVSLEKILEKIQASAGSDERISVLVSSESGSSSLLEDDDVWCIDPRGVLTLSVCKNTYETLGLVGKRVTFGKGKGKQGDGRHVISIPLYTKNAEPQKIRARRDVSIKRWDTQRAQMNCLSAGSPTWNVLISSGVDKAAQILSEIFKDSDARAEDGVLCKESLKDVNIPVIRLSPCPSRQDGISGEEYDDLFEDWEYDMEALFEWIGLAGLGSQRLKANDRTDPYISSYEIPSPSVVGDVTHLKWTGFLEHSFVQGVIDVLIQNLSDSPGANQFVSISGHTCGWSPISYVPPNLQDVSSSNLRSPMRDPTMEAEDTWCLIMTGDRDSSRCRWALARNGSGHDSWE